MSFDPVGVISAVKSQLGVPYSWGGEDPNTDFDCSGLVQWAYSTVGVVLPRTSEQQWSATQRVSPSAAIPGDLVFFEGTPPGHVGIYIGGGQMIDAPYTGAKVRVDSVSNPVGYGRVSGNNMSTAGVGGALVAGAASSSATGSMGSGGCNSGGGFFILTACQGKALLGGIAVAGGGFLTVVGLTIVAAYGLGHTGAGRTLGRAAVGFTPIGRAVKAVKVL